MYQMEPYTGHYIQNSQIRQAQDTVVAFLKSGHATVRIGECDATPSTVFNALKNYLCASRIEGVTVTHRRGQVFLTNDRLPQPYPFDPVEDLPARPRQVEVSGLSASVTDTLWRFAASGIKCARLKALPEENREKTISTYRTIASKRCKGISVYYRDGQLYLVNRKLCGKEEPGHESDAGI